ncbi:MAG: DUF3108 domain-containing protein [Candidatus Omnitrophica bacterium]|nr:DUF3108 domain-containing protein [Candidatus Omnitrophota bacterium]
MRCLLSFLIIAVGFVPFCQAQEIPFRAGEVLQYQLKWNVFTGGKILLTVQEDAYLEGERAFHLQAEAETEGMFHKFYPFRVKIESFVSRNDFLPLRYQYSSWAPDETRLEVTSFPRGQPQGKYHLDQDKKGNKRVKDEMFDVSDFFQDPLSVLYYIRTQELNVGEQIEIPLSVDRKNYKILVNVLRRTRIKAVGKTWNAFILEPKVSLGETPFKFASLWIWVSADAARIPLYFSSRAPLGVISGTLIKIGDD